MIKSGGKIDIKRLLILLLLLGLSFSSNFFSVPLFMGVELFPGSIFVLITIYVYGVGAGVVAAALSVIPTYYLWGHFGAGPVFISEALVVGCLLKYRRCNLISAEILFWIFPGAVICWIFARYGSDLDFFAANLVVLKQFLNSMCNAAVASILLYIPALRVFLPGIYIKNIYLLNLIFSFVAFVFVGTAFGYCSFETQYHKRQYYSEFGTRFYSSVNSLKELVQLWRKTCMYSVTQLAGEIEKLPDNLKSPNLQEMTRYFATSTSIFHSIHVSDMQGKTLAFYSANNKGGQQAIGRNLSGHGYYRQIIKSGKSFVSNVFMSDSHPTIPTVAFCVPVYDGSSMKGYVVGESQLDFLQHFMKTLDYEKGSVLYLVDSENNLVGSSEESGARVTRFTYFDNKDFYTVNLEKGIKLWLPKVISDEAERYRCGFFELRSKISDVNWELVGRMPSSIIVNRYISLNQRTLLVVFAALVLSSILIYILTQIIVRPISKLASISIALADSDYTDGQSLEWPASFIYEFETLISNFRLMLASKQEYITALNHSNSVLAQREEDLSITLDSIGEGVIVTDDKGLVLEINPVAEKLTGWNVQEAIDHNVSEVLQLMNSSDRLLLKSPVPGVIESGEMLSVKTDLTLISKSGQEYRIINTISPVFDHKGVICGAVMVFRDITEEHNMEKNMRQSQKMEAIGQLAGGIAHDFNNMLGGILGFAELIQSRVKSDDVSKEYCDNIITTSERAAKLTSQLLSFSRKGKIFSTPFDIHSVITDSVEILKRSIDKLITIELKFKAENSVIRGDSTQLQNSFINFGINARDAMPQGGVFSVMTRNLRINNPCEVITENDLEPGEYIVIEISDTGSGMDKETIRHIYEPFFTTKEIGRGTGLGLSAIYGSIISHNGAINVFSNPGFGTTFCVFLPVIYQKPHDVTEESWEIKKGTGTILVIDDEEIICTMVKTVLLELGYKALVTTSPIEGIELFRKYHAEISVVLLDMMMPEMSGVKCLEKLREIDPKPKVVLCSGFTHDNIRSEMIQYGYNGFLEKPYRRSQLSSLLHELIN